MFFPHVGVESCHDSCYINLSYTMHKVYTEKKRTKWTSVKYPLEEKNKLQYEEWALAREVGTGFSEQCVCVWVLCGPCCLPHPPTRQPPLSLLQAAFFVIKWLSHFSSRQDYVKGENQLLLYLKLNDRRQVGGAGNCLLKIIQTSTTISQP